MDTGPNWLRFGDGYSNYSGFPNSSLIIDQFVGFNEMFSAHDFVEIWERRVRVAALWRMERGGGQERLF